jgi:hypothetical protein
VRLRFSPRATQHLAEIGSAAQEISIITILHPVRERPYSDV